MFELEDYSSGLHDGLLSKYSDLTSPALDFYITDSLQDMLDVDIRSEIASVVGNGIGNDLSSMLNDLPSSLDHAMDVISSINNNNSTSNSFTNHLNLNNTSINNNSSSLSSSGGSTWMGPSWSSSSTNNNDYYVDLGACVNPISVMPLISSSIMRSASSLANLNSASTPAFPNSPTHGNETNKSHLTFSPAQMKAGSIRHEQISSHIPKQIVSISSAVTAGTTAPATMATNAGLQRKLNRQQVQAVSVDGVKKDLQNIVSYNDIKSQLNNSTNGGIIINNETRQNISADSATNTIKLAPGIGGLTFANSLTYNKIKQQTIIKSSSGSPLSTNNANNNIVVKKERDSSPLRMSNMNGNKLVARQSFTPKSIAITAHAMRASSPAQSISMSPSSSHSSSSNSSLGTSPSNATNNIFTTSFVNNNNSAFQNMNGVNVKTLQQKVKVLTTDSEFPKPAYSYSCLIAMALKNSRSGSLPVSEIYSFMCEHFPYFKTAPSGWKNSVRHNLSLNKCFEKIEKPATNNNQRKGCLWAMNPDRIAKMDDEVLKWSRKDPKAIRRAMVHPEHLEALERGEMKHGSTGDSDMELDSQSEIEEASDLEEPEVDDLLIDNCLVEEAGEEDHEHEFGVEGGFPEIDDTEQLTNDQQTLVNEIVESMETPNLSQSTSASRDFDIEVDDIYDAIDIEDDKSMLNIKLEDDIIEIGPADLEMNALTPTTKHQQQLQQQFVQQKQQQQQRSSPTVVVSVADFQSAKRARLSYTTQQQQQQQQTPQSALQRQQFLNKQQLLQLQQQMKQQQILQQANSTVSLRKVKVLQQITKSQPQTNQHVVVHTLANTTPTVSFVSANNINNNMHVRNNSGFLQFSTLQQSQPQQQQQLQRRKIQMSNRIVENN